MPGSPDRCSRFESASKLAASTARMALVKKIDATVGPEITASVACSLRECPVIAMAVIRGQRELLVENGQVLSDSYVYPSDPLKAHVEIVRIGDCCGSSGIIEGIVLKTE